MLLTVIQTTLTEIRGWSHRQEAPAQTTVFFAVLLVASLPTAPFLLSISMWGLVFVAFWAALRAQQGTERGFHLGWALVVFSFKKMFSQRIYTVWLLLLLVPLLSGLWSEDQGYWLERVRVRLPFLVLPWAFANFPALSRRQIQLVLYFLVAWMAVLCMGVGINFLLDHTAILEAMQQGRPMPVPRNHIRFSLLLATAGVAGGWLWHERFVWRYAWERKVLPGVVLFLFVFAHVLSVRSGLLALYVVLFFSMLYFVWHTRRWKLTLLALALLVLIPWMAVKTLPSLAQKIAYTKYDLEQYLNNTGENYSDSERLISLKTGWLIWKENPWLGAGAGDLRQETKRQVTIHFPKYVQTPKLPHNQFVYILAGTGLAGLLLSMFAFLYPVFAGRLF
ncbi:MAG: O-antigen ligase family protein [Lewinellaceae bacterium]|nr:O-antigen ligase family protein [Lewinellaceae bacterium]